MGQIEDLKLFVSVVDNQSITRAAAVLNIAKSAVSRRLSLIEERYGSKLIDRKSGNWQVTATGFELYQRANLIVIDVDEIEQDFMSKDCDLQGPLTVSLPRVFGLANLRHMLTAFTKKYPEITLTVDFDDRIVNLVRENYDFAVRITPKPDESFITKRLGSTHHIVCASPNYLSDKGTPSHASDLMGHSLLHFGTAQQAQWQFKDRSGKVDVIKFPPFINSNSGEFLLNAAIEEMGIVKLPDFLVGPQVTQGKLIQLLPDLLMPDLGIFLIHSPGRRMNKRMRLFSKELEAACLGM
jgi:DNA-binding transcriptional LysR family regulator